MSQNKCNSTDSYKLTMQQFFFFVYKHCSSGAALVNFNLWRNSVVLTSYANHA